MSEDLRFSEWMVNEALNRRLKEEGPAWFFNLEAHAPGLAMRIRDICEFEADKNEWKYEESLVRDVADMGSIPQDRFGSQYWGIRPDFRFFTHGRRQQLIVEGKGVRSSKNNEGQARRYFSYLAEFQATGAVMYLVPHDESQRWLSTLENIASDYKEIRCGVIPWEHELLGQLSHDLVHVIAESLIGPTRLMEKAMKYRKGLRETPAFGGE